MKNKTKILLGSLAATSVAAVITSSIITTNIQSNTSSTGIDSKQQLNNNKNEELELDNNQSNNNEIMPLWDDHGVEYWTNDPWPDSACHTEVLDNKVIIGDSTYDYLFNQSEKLRGLRDGIFKPSDITQDFLEDFMWQIQKGDNYYSTMSSYILRCTNYVPHNKDLFWVDPTTINVDLVNNKITFCVQLTNATFGDAGWYVTQTRGHKKYAYGVTYISNFTISGVNLITSDKNDPDYSDYNTMINSNMELNWPNTLAQSVSEPKNMYIEGNDGLKQEILNRGAIVQAKNHETMTTNDFSVEIEDQLPKYTDVNTSTSGYNNVEGNVVAKITFNPGKFYVDGKASDNPVVKYININGFKKLPQTTIKNLYSNENYNGRILDKKNNIGSSKIFASSMNVEKVTELFNSGFISPSTFFNNIVTFNSDSFRVNPYLKESYIKVEKVTPNNAKGEVYVDASLYGYENDKEYVNSEQTKWPFKFTLIGYYSENDQKEDEYFNTTIVPSITINNFGKLLPQDAIVENSLLPDIKDAILNYIIANYKTVFSNLNPEYASSIITRSDLDIWLDTSNHSFNNKDGVIYIDVQLANGKAWTNGIPDVNPPKIFMRIPIYGFKKQAPTINKTSTIKNNDVSNELTTSFSYNDAVKFLNDHKNEIYDNLPLDASIIVDPDSYDNKTNVDSGMIYLKISPSSYYDPNEAHYVSNNIPSEWLDFIIVGFKSSSNDANIFNTSFNGGTLSDVSSILPQFVADSKDHINENVIGINAIKNFLLDGNIIGLPPSSVGNVSANDLDVAIQSFNNLTGEIVANVTLKNNKGWEGGKNKQSITKQLTFSGFKTVKETKFNFDNKELTIQEPYSDKFATQFSLEDAQKYIDMHVNELWTNLPSDAKMFVKDIDYSLVDQGKISLKVDTSLWYGNNGILNTNTFQNAGYHTLVINGFNSDSSLLTTTVNGVVTLNGMDDVLAQDATQDKYWNGSIKPQVFRALNMGNYVNNLANNINHNVLNSTNMDLFCLPNTNPTDLNVIGSKTFWDNSTGTITVRLQIQDNLAWKDGIIQPTMDFPLKITGFKKVSSTIQNNTTINVEKYNCIDWSKKLASDFISNINGFINENKNKIYQNLPSDAILSIESNPIVLNKNGTITVSVNTNEYYSSSDGTKLIKSKMDSPITITLTGFTNVDNNASIFTTQINGTRLNNVENILPDYLTNNLENISSQQKQIYIDQIKQSIVDANCVINLAQERTLKPSDIELTNIIANNKEGSITATVKIKNGVAQTNGDPNPNFEQTSVKFTGFKTMQPTVAKLSASILLPNVSAILPYDANKAQIEEYLNKNKEQLFNNVVNNSKILINSITNDDLTLTNNGQVSANISISPTYDQNGNLTNNGISNDVIISGFKPSAGVNTVIANKNININGIGNKRADDVFKSQDNEVKNIIINYLANNENIFSNLVTGTDLTPNDISIGEFSNPINIDGTLVVNNVTINNNKALINGLPVSSYNLGSITISGFKKQAPTIWLNTNENPLQFDEFRNIKITDITNKTLESILQNHISEIVQNAPENIKIKVNINDASTNIDKGILKATVNIPSYYDQYGNLVNDNFKQEYTFGFFINNTDSTSIYEVDLSDKYSSQLASEVINNTASLANDIKNQIMNKNLIVNSYPLAGPIVDKFKVEIIPNSSNNLNGTVQAKVILDNGYYMENGVVINPSKPILTTITGFKKVIPTNIDSNAINNVIDKKQNVNQLINNKKTITDIQNAIADTLTDNMFPSNKPNINDIKVNLFNPDSINGSFDVEVKIPGPYIDNDGNVQTSTFDKIITISGCKCDTSTTIVVNGNINNCNTIIATSLNNNISIDVINKIKQEILNANLIKNTTTGKTFTINDFDIQFITSSANNLDGSINANITIHPGFVSNSGIKLETAKTWSNIKLVGFQKLKPTKINPIIVNNVVDKNLNVNEILSSKEQIEKIKDAAYTALTNNMFPNGNKPLKDNIQFNFNCINTTDGSFNVQIIISSPTVNNDGSINNNGTELNILVSGCKSDNNTTSACDGILNGCQNIIASEITSKDYPKIINAIIANGKIINQISSNKEQSISANDIDISIDTSTADNLKGTVQATITIKNGYASKNGVIQNNPVTLSPITISGFRILKPTNITENDIKDFNCSDYTVNEFLNNPNTIKILTNLLIKNIDPKMFPNGNKLTTNKIKIEIINSDPANGTINLNVTLDVPQYVDQNGNIINGNYQKILNLNGFKKDNTTTTVLNSKKINGLSNLIPSEVTNQNIKAINQIKQAIIDDYYNNKDSINPPLLQNLNSSKPNITVNDIDVNIINNKSSNQNNLTDSISITINIKNGYACENGKELESKQFGPIVIEGLKQLEPTVINPLISITIPNLSAAELIDNGSLNKIVQDEIMNNINPSMFPNGIKSSDIIVSQPTKNDINNTNGIIKVSVAINTPWVDSNGNIHNLNGNEMFMTNITVTGLKNVKDKTWIENNWWIILVSVAGSLITILAIVFITKFILYKRQK